LTRFKSSKVALEIRESNLVKTSGVHEHSAMRIQNIEQPDVPFRRIGGS
jgi:hypothetical protein